MADLISVIVPVYNAGEYIGDCVESVLRQTYTHFELILVDDGSTDHSAELCEKICTADVRIRFIRQQHKGVSAARNAGMEAAEGKYLFFLDVDDIIHPRLLSVLYVLMKKKRAAIATENCRNVEENFQVHNVWEIDTDDICKSTYLNGQRALEAFVFGKPEAALNMIGGKMISRKVTEAVRFDEKLTHGEDTLFLYQLLEKGADVVFLHNSWYYYRKYEGSANGNFSVPACQSRYRAERYILDHEIKSGRIANAIYWEKVIVEAVMAWYQTGRKTRDERLIEFVRHLADYERKRKIFSRIDWYGKLRFFLLFSCYPLYRIIYLLYTGIVRCPWFSSRKHGDC